VTSWYSGHELRNGCDLRGGDLRRMGRKGAYRYDIAREMVVAGIRCRKILRST
jgi:hypothetical protein